MCILLTAMLLSVREAAGSGSTTDEIVLTKEVDIQTEECEANKKEQEEGTEQNHGCSLGAKQIKALKAKKI